MRPGDRVCAACDLYDRAADEQFVPHGAPSAVSELSMFGRSVLIDYDNGISLLQRTRHRRTLPT